MTYESGEVFVERYMIRVWESEFNDAMVLGLSTYILL